MMVFLDCEFTNFEDPQLLSVGLVSSDGRELNVELAGEVLLSQLADASEFVLDAVTPQFGLMPHQAASLFELGQLVGTWLLGLGEQSVDIAYDYHSDFDLFERALRDAGLWDHLQNVIKPTHVGYLIGQPDVEEAMETSWTASFVADRIGRHHALADARALRAGFEAMHGGGPATHLGRFDGEGLVPSEAPAKYELTPEQVAWFEGVVERHRQLEADEDDDAGATPADAPIIFLDLDDVVCLSDPMGGYDAVEAVRGKRIDANRVFALLFHEPAREVLKAVHERLSGQVRYVITSTWRKHLNRSQMAEVLRRGGLDFVAASLERKGRWATPDWPDRTRLNEIADWLARHGVGEPFVVIDDEYSGQSLVKATAHANGPFFGRVVLCREDIGLLAEHVEVIVEALRRPLAPAK